RRSARRGPARREDGGDPDRAGDGARVRGRLGGRAARVREARAAGADLGERIGARRQGPGHAPGPPRRSVGGRAMSHTLRIERTFAALRASGRKALVAYLCMGDPSLDESVELAVAAAEAGADLLELGVPFSDPTADGPVIARASMRAIAGGATISRVLDA